MLQQEGQGQGLAALTHVSCAETHISQGQISNVSHCLRQHSVLGKKPFVLPEKL